MISGNDYTTVLTTTISAGRVGLVIVPTGSFQSGTPEEFAVVRHPERHPQETQDAQESPVFQGAFEDVTKFIAGCVFIADSYNDLGVVDAEQIELAERDMILMNAIKQGEVINSKDEDGNDIYRNG